MLKLIPFLFQIILVVGGVLLFAYFDPFGIFTPKRTLKNTPIDVQSIKSIGQLITAEYYGEVVRSYAHKAVEEGEEESQAMRETIENIHDLFLLVTGGLKGSLEAKEINKREIFDQYKELMGEWRNDVYYGQYLNFLFVTQFKKSRFTENQLDKRLNDKHEEQIVKWVVDGRNSGIENISLEPLYGIFGQALQKEQQKKYKKSNLIMLGRGWVKAGFDFGEFNEDNFRYDASRNRIFFIGLKPQILSATINPWFIPEKGVEGFEFLVVQRKVRRDYKVVTEVKQMCLDELIRKAFERDILLLATNNAKEALKEFFSLLLPGNVDHVIFYENELDYALDEITRNDTISGEELLLIEHMLTKSSYIGIGIEDTVEMNKQRVIFKESLKKYPVNFFGQDVATGWSPHWSMAYEVARDGVYDQHADRIVIERYTRENCSDPIWDSVCKDQGLEFIKNNVEVFVSRDSIPWSAKDLEVLRERLSASDSLWVQTGNKTQLTGLRISLDEDKQPLDSLIFQRGGELCKCR
jgi:hypothetical protein